MACTKKGDHAKAESHLAQLSEKQELDGLKAKFVPHTSSPYECAEVAEYILLANIRFQQNKNEEALAAIKLAIRAEDSILYSEPKLWLIPARQYLGAFLMQMKDYKGAEKVYREDLMWNPGNGWSLLGLHQSLEAQGKKGELAKLKKLYTASFSEADVMPVRSAN